MIAQQFDKFRSLVHYVGWPLAVLLVWDVLVTMVYVTLHARGGLDLPSNPVTLAGSALVLFLSLRNNAAYARWWEARTLWGAIVNASRIFARQVATMLDQQHDRATASALGQAMVKRQIAYAFALRHHLLRLPPEAMLAELQGLADSERALLAGQSNIPNALLTLNAQDMALACRQGRLGAYDRVMIEQTLVQLTNAQGGLERIRNTPLPKQYAIYPRLFVSAFCLLMPLGMVDELLVYTPVVSTLVGFMLMTMEKMGSDLQDPFSNDIHDIPMEPICQTIRHDLLQSLDAQCQAQAWPAPGDAPALAAGAAAAQVADRREFAPQPDQVSSGMDKNASLHQNL